MAALEIGATLRARSIGREWLARHPEWWVLAVSAGAWLVLAVAAQHRMLPALCLAPSTDPLTASLAGLQAAQKSSQLAWEVADWVLMIAAMMLPLVVLPVRHVAFRSFRDRRHRAIAEFLAGYVGVWILAGMALLPVPIAASALGATQNRLVVAIGYSIAVAWQLTPFKMGALRRCHRTVPLAPDGWRAAAACIRFGLGSGGSCLASCWALMAVPVLTSHGLAAMACIQAVMVRERYQRRPRPQTAASILLLGAAFLFDFLPGET
jgi:predicted metal-binding membrane protein